MIPYPSPWDSHSAEYIAWHICLLNFLAGARETLSINLVKSFRGIICFPNCKGILYFFFSIVMVQRIKNLPAMQETWIGSLDQKDPLDKGMATHSNILAWRIPWTKEPGRLQSMRSQRVIYDWAINTFIFIVVKNTDCKEIQPVHSKGDQSWVFFGRSDAKAETPVLWPPHAKNWLIGKDSDAGRDWGQEEKGTTEDEMAGWHHRLDRHEFEWTPGVGNGQGGLACCNSWGHKESDTIEWLNWTERTQIQDQNARTCI